MENYAQNLTDTQLTGGLFSRQNALSWLSISARATFFCSFRILIYEIGGETLKICLAKEITRMVGIKETGTIK